MKGIVPINFILMANTIKCKNPINMKVYDLKGSMINRTVKKDGGKAQTLKDKNLLFCKEYRQNRQILGLLQFKNKLNSTLKNENDVRYIKDVIEKDSLFLKKCGFLDYSILLAVEYRDEGFFESSEDSLIDENTAGA